MERKGFVMISRDILDVDMWRDPYDGLLFFYCLMKASHNYFNVLKPGQLYFSVQSAAKKLQWSRNSVAKHLRALSDSGLITVKTTDLGSIITINSWNQICGEPANTHDGAAFVQNSQKKRRRRNVHGCLKSIHCGSRFEKQCTPDEHQTHTK